jgi:hypothetical protein
METMGVDRVWIRTGRGRKLESGRPVCILSLGDEGLEALRGQDGLSRGYS